MTDPATAEQHEQNLRDLAMIRDDPGWALTAVQQWRRLSERVDALSARLAQAEQERDDNYAALQAMKVEWRAVFDTARDFEARLRVTEARLREYEKALQRIADLPVSPAAGWVLALKAPEIARVALEGQP